jgi:hypothetical protein
MISLSFQRFMTGAFADALTPAAAPCGTAD